MNEPLWSPRKPPRWFISGSFLFSFPNRWHQGNPPAKTHPYRMASRTPPKSKHENKNKQTSPSNRIPPPPNQTPPTRSEEAIHGFNHGFNQCDVWIRPLPPRLNPPPEPRLRKRAPGAAQLAPAGLAGLRRPGAAAELAAAGAGDARARGHGAGRGSWSAAGREVGGGCKHRFWAGARCFFRSECVKGKCLWPRCKLAFLGASWIRNQGSLVQVGWGWFGLSWVWSVLFGMFFEGPGVTE